MAKQTRIQHQLHERHRAHKRDSVAAQPTGFGRDARHAEKRATLRAKRAEAEEEARRVECEQIAAREAGALALLDERAAAGIVEATGMVGAFQSTVERLS